MPKYAVRFVRSARKELESLPAAVVQRILPRVESLADDPRPSGSKKLRGARDLWRLRIGNYRVVYQIDDSVLVVEVRAVGDRKDVYG